MSFPEECNICLREYLLCQSTAKILLVKLRKWHDDGHPKLQGREWFDI